MRSVSSCRPPERPYFPLVLSFACSFWFASSVTYTMLRHVSSSMCAALAFMSLMISFAPFLFLLRSNHKLIFVLALGILCGVLVGSSYALQIHQQETAVFRDGVVRVRVLEDSVDYGYGASCPVEIISDNYAGIKAQATFSQDELNLLYGDVIEGFVCWSEIPEASSQRFWGKAQVGRFRFIDASFEPIDTVFAPIMQLRKGTIALFDAFKNTSLASGASFMQALLCGYRGSLSNTDLYESFKETGIVHLVAVSGSHLTLVSLGISVILKCLRVGKRCSIGVQLFVIFSYLIFTACSPSSVRAAIMAAAVIMSFFIKRRGSPLATIALAIISFILFNPAHAVSISFLLSVLSTLSIVLFTPLVTWWLRRLNAVIPSVCVEAFAMTLSSGILISAYSSALFSQLSCIGLIANVVAVPLFVPLCVVGAFGCCISLLVPQCFAVAMTIVCGAGEMFCVLIHVLALVPFASIPVSGIPELFLLVSIVFALLLWWKWPIKATGNNLIVVIPGCVLLFVLQVSLPINHADRIVMLDVGQGDALLIQSNGTSVLIDTGTNDSMLRSALASNGVYDLDAVFITHGDDDHMGSLMALSHVCEIGTIGLSEHVFTCSCDACDMLKEVSQNILGQDEALAIAVGDEITVGNFSLEVLWPLEFCDEGGNGDSLCFLVKYITRNGDLRPVALLTGDIEVNQLTSVIERFRLPNIPILKVGHHGSKASLSQETARMLQPQVALIGVGAQNRYGHPSEDCLSILDNVSAKVFRTDLHGNISCVFSETGEFKVEVG